MKQAPLWSARRDRLLYSLALLFCFSAIRGDAQSQRPRTVMASEIGSIFATPNGFDWSQVGAYVGAPKSELFSYMAPAAIKVVHARFHVFKESDEWQWNYFPYSGFRMYEGQEVAAGRPPIFVTAYYQGKTRQVVWSWSLGLQANSNKPTRPATEWEYAVNVQDDRFIQYWIQYVRGLEKEYASLSNLWIGLDEAAFMPGLYGVIDDNGNFVQGVQWDQPFPQTAADYYNSIHNFFTRVKQLAPDFKMMPNSGGISDWSQFKNTFGAAQGLMLEEINPENSASDFYVRTFQYNQMVAYSNESALGYPMVFASIVPVSSASRIVDSYVMYLLLRGPNTFYAPEIAGTYNALPPALYQDIGSALGEPTSSFSCKPAAETATENPGLCVYSRTFQNGAVYLNWTGKAQTIKLPTNEVFYDANHRVVTSLSLPDLRAAYVLNH